MWTYINIFYIPWFTELILYIYKFATSSHFKPGLFEVTSLTWLLPDPRISFSRTLLLSLASKSDLHHIPELCRFMIPELRRLRIPELRRFQSSWNRQQIRAKELDSAIIFAHCLKAWKHLRIIRISSWTFPFHETGVFTPRVIHELISQISANLTFRGCKVFA
jgi:hypothetical protein